jgi:LPXTG-site transpeptidase (sortase) family protein
MKSLKLNRVLITVGLVLLLGGGGVLLSVYRSMRTSIVNTVSPAAHAAAKTPVSSDPVRIEGNPVKIDIPSLDISLPVAPGAYDPETREWTLSIDKVQYATMTPQPNTASGNTFIYGHYRKNLFSSLHTIQPGAVVVITTENNHTFYYEFTSSKIVNPSATTVLATVFPDKTTMGTPVPGFVYCPTKYSPFNFFARTGGRNTALCRKVCASPKALPWYALNTSTK